MVMWVSGIDENGLGPRLGPLLTTAVTLVLDGPYDAPRMREIGLESGLTDSKAVASTRAMTFCEGVALGLLDLAGHDSLNASQVFGALHLGGAGDLRAPCPDAATAALCFGQELALPAYGGRRDEGRARVERALASAGARLVRVRTVVACVGVLNAARNAGTNKLVMDLAAMERLALDARSRTDEDPVLAVCGMVGGMRDVPRFVRHFDATGMVTVEASRTVRSYRTREGVDLRFEVDADASHLPVALASIVGKYLRELAMRRIVSGLRAHDASLPEVSGYHDNITARFVAGSAALRKRLRIVDACFERDA